MLVGAPDGMPLAFALVAANTPERQAAAGVLEPLDMHGDPLIADQGFAGADCEALLDSLGATFLRPDRQHERRHHGSLGPIRPWIAPVSATLEGQPSLKRHGPHTRPGPFVRIR